MFEVAFLGIVALVLYRRRAGSRNSIRTEVHRALAGLGSLARRAHTRALRAGPGLMRQCAADLKSLWADMAGVVSPGRATDRGEAVVAAVSGPEDTAFSQLQRRYLDGRITLQEYVESARAARGLPS